MKNQEIINYSKYPIDQMDNPIRQEVINNIKEELNDDGCALLKNFLSEPGLNAFIQEAIHRKPYAYFSKQKVTNAYLNEGDKNLPQEHPVNYLMPRTNGFITADNFDEESLCRNFYYWQPLTRFIAECLEKEELFIYADPVSNMIVNVGVPGAEFNWHFDTNEFTITMLLKPAQSGGLFEYVPNIRNAKDEQYEEVEKVLKGNRNRIKQLDLQPGDLQLFLGRFSLHKVTQNTGNVDRLLLIMSFAEKEDMVGSKERVQQLYGKTMQVHENQPTRNDGLRD